LKEKQIVTSFLESGGKILLLRRSDRVSTYQGKWAGVSGYLEPPHTPYQQALIELKEEVGLTEAVVELAKSGTPLERPDKELGIKWIVHPFRFRVKDATKIRLDWEHEELKWVLPSEISRYDTVPNLFEAFLKVAST